MIFYEIEPAYRTGSHYENETHLYDYHSGEDSLPDGRMVSILGTGCPGKLRQVVTAEKRI